MFMRSIDLSSARNPSLLFARLVLDDFRWLATAYQLTMRERVRRWLDCTELVSWIFLYVTGQWILIG